jgi:tetratricopeptide (TPR) repeat protein
MPETLPVDPAGAGASPDPDREARIEELLLAGLDRYFAGRYEEAINIWTRVAFLERAHGRARAYIERARGAQAERQRESEELLHRGITAYHAGDTSTARTLLMRAVEEGGPTDVALAFLQRLNRFDAAADRDPLARMATDAIRTVVPELAPTRWLPTLVVSAAIALGIVLLALPVTSWIVELPIAAPPAEAARPEPLPLARPSDMLLARAQALRAGGKLKDALVMLERINRSDPLRPEADHLKAIVQREALAAARVPLDEEKGPAR